MNGASEQTGWHHIVEVYDGTITRRYVDGVLDLSTDAGNSPVVPDTSRLNRYERRRRLYGHHQLSKEQS